VQLKKRFPIKEFKELIPGLDSYRGRYAYISLIASLALLSFAYLSWSQFSRVSESQISANAQRTQAAGLVVDAQSRLNTLENHLQRIFIEPRTDHIVASRQGNRELNEQLRQLSDFLGSAAEHLTKRLLAESRQLGGEVERLLEVRQDVEGGFPAMSLLQDEMYPANQEMQGELQSLMQEAQQGLTPAQYLVVMEEIVNLRGALFGMVQEMYYFIVYRFGVFAGNTPLESPDYPARVDDFAVTVARHIANLRRIFSEEGMGLDISERIDRLDSLHQRWSRGSKQVFFAMKNSAWRRDMMLMRENIAPMLSSMRERLALIDLQLEQASASRISHLILTARKLSESILGIAMVGVLLILGAYLYINRNLLKPIAQTTHALKEQARGATDVLLPPVRLKETRDLIKAFSEIRRQGHQRQRYLDHIAHHDALTQLPNRSLFRDRLEHALAIALRGETQVGLMFLDLDRFKQVNDSFGHLIGDELLRKVADRLVSLVRNSDTVARLGGDEFAVLVEGFKRREDVSVLAKKILQVVERPMLLDGQQLQISVSIGIATAPHDDISAEYLIRDADAAMYEAKSQGRASYCFFSRELTSRATEALLLENQVRQAAERGEYVFHFQPVINSSSGELFCFEALLRWNHPTRGILYPDEFLSVLDQTGVIISALDPLLEQAIAFQQDQHQQYGRKVAIAINLSVRLLNDTSFRKIILERLIAHDFLPNSLILEITEEILMQDLVDADVFLQQVKALGARIALDDFGSGQSSLSHLRQFPFDFLKIDREFIRNADTDTNEASLVQAMIQLAHAFGMLVIAEGVESESQLKFLQSLDCDYLQGYLIGVPNHAEHKCELSTLMPLFQNQGTSD
jgi:diguanylate cyclase (GGDEF)-like protein